MSTQTGACAECGGPIRFAPGIGWAHTGTEPPRGAPHRARYLTAPDDGDMISGVMDEPCIACGAPITDCGGGHDEGCPVMVTDTTIAADMARAAIDNRETWTGLTGYAARGSQPRYIAASQTARTGVLVYAPED